MLNVAGGPDPLNPWSRETPPENERKRPYDPSAEFSFGVPRNDQLDFFDDADSASLFDEAIATLESFGGRRVEIDYAPFLDANEMMFQGPFVAERLASVGDFLSANPKAGDPTVRRIIEGAARFSAADAFKMLYRLRELCHQVAPLWEAIDVLVLPTVGPPYTIAELEADPFGPNFRNGTYTNFSNLLDMAALAVPNGFHPVGVPVGITLNGPAFSEAYLVALGSRFQAARVQSLGATDASVPAAA